MRMTAAARKVLDRPPYTAAFLGCTVAVGVGAGDALLGALAGALFGAIVTTVGCAMVGARGEAAAEFLKRLGDLEGAAADASGHPLALRRAVETLVGQGVWLKEDASVFGRLLRVRDALLHEDPPARTDLLTSMLEIDRLASLIAGAARSHPQSP